MGAQRARFTADDGRNVWRFIIDQRAGRCFGVIDAEPEEPIVE